MLKNGKSQTSFNYLYSSPNYPVSPEIFPMLGHSAPKVYMLIQCLFRIYCVLLWLPCSPQDSKLEI